MNIFEKIVYVYGFTKAVNLFSAGDYVKAYRYLLNIAKYSPGDNIVYFLFRSHSALMADCVDDSRDCITLFFNIIHDNKEIFEIKKINSDERIQMTLFSKYLKKVFDPKVDIKSSYINDFPKIKEVNISHTFKVIFPLEVYENSIV